MTHALGGYLGGCSSQQRGAPDPGMVLKAPSRGEGRALPGLIRWINSGLKERTKDAARYKEPENVSDFAALKKTLNAFKADTLYPNPLLNLCGQISNIFDLALQRLLIRQV